MPLQIVEMAMVLVFFPYCIYPLNQAGRVPRTICAEVTEDLVNICVPGDVAHLTGVVRALAVSPNAHTTLKKVAQSSSKHRFDKHVACTRIADCKPTVMPLQQ